MSAAQPPPAGPSGDGDDLHAIAGRAFDDIAAAADLVALEAERGRYLGRRDGLLSTRRRGLGEVPDPEVRRQLGQTLNELIGRVDQALQARHAELEAGESAGRLAEEGLDLTLPAVPLRRGHLHPITRCLREMRRIFASLGYTAVSAPEVEWDRYNFSLVNMPPGHPSRATQDTFFIDDQRVLRTHTSPGQIRSLVSIGAPLRVIVPGKAFRRDYDATHFPMFHQVEGLCVDTDISLGDLKGTLEYFARSLFGGARAVRLRPHHFEFTEPSIEVDVSCMVCGGDGCRTCKFSGWIEMLGGGLVHPQVLRNGGVDPAVYSGFAFGIGVERVAQLLYAIDDGRQLFENDVRFLREA
ncbi:MAG: phenylalanine--tRNA ligase subunit alpha [Candidatus Dormibacteria bacterium]